MKWIARTFTVVCTFTILASLVAPSASAQTIPANYFGLHMSAGVTYSEGWPTIGIGGFRLLTSSTNWAEMNPAPGVYDWTMLDRWLTLAQAHGVTADDIIYTFTAFPTWASSNPTDRTCSSNPGSCDAPNDLNADGSGTDQIFKDFATALAHHVAGRIRYWEVWNEPYWKPYFTGTPAQIVRMAQDLRTIVQSVDPNAKILSPAGSDMYQKLKNACWAAKTIDQYFAAGIGPYIDVVNFHAYFAAPDATDQPENYVLQVQCIRDMMAARGQQDKPLWASEGSWAHNWDLPNPDDQAAFVARSYLLMWSLGVKRFYWFRYDNSQAGTLYNNGLLMPGQAYGIVADWLTGATQTKPCEEQGTIWTCNYTLADGTTAQAVWSTTRQPYTPPSYFTKYRTLWGATTLIPTDRQISVYRKPKLLQ
jgi:polysaccharide biosynthesis protein PslG